ncbi:MAG: tetratricopeptide repeat protein [Gammaproteobacteria bacterium]
MSNPVDKLVGFLRELRRRNVYRVATVYVAVAFLALEAIDLLIPSTTLPPWVDEFLLAIAMLGFPIAVVVAWAVESTPDGLRLTQAVDSGNSQPQQGARSIVVPLGLVIMAAAVWWFVVDGGDNDTAETDRTIAVLPFETVGSETDDVFADGMHLGVLTRLSNVSNLDVISRTSVMAFRDSEKTLPQIAGALGASWVLRADIQESGDNVQVHARLVDARQDRQVWAQDYRRSLSAANVFEIQAELSRSIIDAMHAKLTRAEGRRVDKAPTDNLEAYRMVILGRQQINLQTEESFRKAEEYFRMAIDEDPDYAVAWSGLGDATWSAYAYGFDRDESRTERAEKYVLRALELDPDLAEAHAAMSGPYYLRQDGPEVIRQLNRAVELQHNYANAHSWLAYHHNIQGHPEKSLESARRGAVLDPRSGEVISNLSLSYLTTGQYEQALAEALKTEEILPSWPTASFMQGAALYHLSRYEEARAVLEGVSVDWAEDGAEANYALALVATGDSTGARDQLAQIEKSDDLFAAGLVYAALGEKERAIERFQQVDRWRDWPAIAIRSLYPRALGEVRADSRYEQIVRDVDRSWGITD